MSLRVNERRRLNSMGGTPKPPVQQSRVQQSGARTDGGNTAKSDRVERVARIVAATHCHTRVVQAAVPGTATQHTRVLTFIIPRCCPFPYISRQVHQTKGLAGPLRVHAHRRCVAEAGLVNIGACKNLSLIFCNYTIWWIPREAIVFCSPGIGSVNVKMARPPADAGRRSRWQPVGPTPWPSATAQPHLDPRARAHRYW